MHFHLLLLQKEKENRLNTQRTLTEQNTILSLKHTTPIYQETRTTTGDSLLFTTKHTLLHVVATRTSRLVLVSLSPPEAV